MKGFSDSLKKTIQIQNSLENPKFPLKNIHWFKTSSEKKHPNSRGNPQWLDQRLRMATSGRSSSDSPLPRVKTSKGAAFTRPENGKSSWEDQKFVAFFGKTLNEFTDWLDWCLDFFLEETVLEDLFLVVFLGFLWKISSWCPEFRQLPPQRVDFFLSPIAEIWESTRRKKKIWGVP